ncbi:MAG: flagellin [Planctomycetaceae bacterium]|nr:flagellin [Planctomycetaceae bacterium]
MTRINTNVPSLVAQNRLQASNSDLNSALTRLSTGLRINSGKDDPAGLIASEALRSEITGLNKAVTNTRRAGQIITTADSAMGQINSLLNDVRGLVVEAANTGALSSEEISANQLQIDSSLEAINRIAQSTTFQGRKLLDGSLDYTSTVGAASSVADSSIQSAQLGTTGSLSVDVVVDTAAAQATSNVSAAGFTTAAAASTTVTSGADVITFTADNTGSDYNDVQIVFNDDSSVGDVAAAAAYDATQRTVTVTYNSAAATTTNSDMAAITSALDGLGDFSAALAGTGTNALTEPATNASTGKTGGEVLNADIVFQLTGSGGAETFNFSAGTSKEQIASAISLVSDSTGVSASVASGVLNVTSTDYGSAALVEIDVISEGSGGTFGSSLSGARVTGTDISATVNGVEADGVANTLSINTSTLDLSLTVDAGSSTNFSFDITGGGATFQLGADVTSTQQASIGIASVSTGQLGGASGRLYELGSGQAKSLTNDVSGAADVIDEVINKVTSVRGRLGAFQSTTLESNLVSLNETAANLQEAESSIRDADFAAESANLTRAQILVQSGTNVLALANQNPQNVLALLR